MNTPEYLATATNPLTQILLTTVNEILQDVARRIAKAGRLTATAEYQLNRLADMRAFETNYKAIIAQLTNKAPEEIDRLFVEASEQAYVYDKRLFDVKGIPFVPYKDNLYLQQLTKAAAEQTKAAFLNFTQSMGFIDTDGKVMGAKEYYTEVLDSTVFQIATGGKDYQSVIKQAVKKMVDGGLRVVDYESGHKDKIDVATRRAALTGVRQIADKISADNAKKLGTTIFEISYHDGFRPSHGWGGLRYDTAGARYPVLADIEAKNGGGHLGEWNCRHSEFPTFEFIEPKYSPEKLAEMNAKNAETKEYKYNDRNGVEQVKHLTLRDQLDKQRDMERQMRKVRASAVSFKAAELDADYLMAKGRYYAMRDEYKKFSDKMGIDTQFERVYIDGLGRTLSQKDVWDAKKGLNTDVNSGNIKYVTFANDKKLEKNI